MSAEAIPIIVTRAEPGASATVAQLEDRDMAVIRAPALALEQHSDIALPDIQSLAGLVFTSANGVRVYATRRADRSLTAWCVGPATAEAARTAGFSDIRESAGNAVDLAHFIAEHTRPAEHPLLHVANEAATGTLKRTLTELGFRTLFAPLYTMRPAETLPAEITELIASDIPAILLVHSAKGAAAMADLVEPDDLKAWTLVAISDQAAQPLVNFVPTAPFLADAPNEAGLMRALTRALATLSA
ncbi:MAG: uroporphyrinogen-III synthase [Pseudomonadota bacterium]